MSLMATLTSAASLLGTPTDVYYYGTMFIYYGKYFVKINYFLFNKKLFHYSLEHI